MILLRKAHAGSCSLGYTWPEDGSVVEVAPEHVDELLGIPDSDFTVADSASEPELVVEEPAPEASVSEAPAPRTAKKATARKAAASAPATVEE